MGPTSGPIRTKTELTAHPRPTLVGQPVVLTASVRAVGDARGVPIGTVIFLDGKTVLGTIPFHGECGNAANVESSRRPQCDSGPVRERGRIPIQRVGPRDRDHQAPHAKAHVASSPTRPTSTPMGFADAEEDPSRQKMARFDLEDLMKKSRHTIH